MNATNATSRNLDAEELLHLALAASRENRHEGAISYLKQAIELSSDNARARYLLGAEHAQIGLYARAIEEMTEAIRIDPDLHAARFQLGLLHLTSGLVAEATAAWKPLDGLGAEHPLYLFKSGLLSLAANDFVSCRRDLEKGIAANGFSQVLNLDMQKILDQIGTGPAGPDAPAARPEPEPRKAAERTEARHVLLSAYTTPDKIN
jgi:tetratricopeptide (TPR) repeat protein